MDAGRARSRTAAALLGTVLVVGGTAGGAGATAAGCLSAPVAARHAELGGDGGSLGPVAACERPTARATGSFATFRSGVVYRSAATGAWDVSGSFLELWRSAGYENGFLGYPRSGETWSNGGVVRQEFQGGDLYWCTRTADAGPHSVSGAFRGSYEQAGGPYGRLGLPLSQEVRAAHGGVRQNYQYGSSWWTPATGAHTVTGSFADLFQREGSERGRLGYPRTEEVPIRDGGVFQNFDGGVAYWTAGTGAHVLTGAVLAAYASTGYENGPLGYPTSDERPVPGGTRTDFQGGYVSWTPREGTFVVLPPPVG